MHQKVIVIDRRVLLTGSYNFTDAAELRNSEILLVITDPATASKVAAQFKTLYKLSTPAHLVSPGRK
jgi:phosphatidylserine/phosphatidylglycerophosphate/cardiolipin synthase-like enzyme